MGRLSNCQPTGAAPTERCADRICLRLEAATGKGGLGVLGHLSGASRLFPIIGDPIKYVESPRRLTRTFDERGYNGICVPLQRPRPVPASTTPCAAE